MTIIATCQAEPLREKDPTVCRSRTGGLDTRAVDIAQVRDDWQAADRHGPGRRDLGEEKGEAVNRVHDRRCTG